MALTDRRVGGVLAVAAGLAAALAVAPAAAQPRPLPVVDATLSLEEAVDLALTHNLRLKSSSADARAMDSMRRESLAAFWPQLSANGYFADQTMAPNVYTSAGSTMARNYQVFNAEQHRTANVTAMYPLFSGGRDWYAYKAASRRAEAGREMVRGTEVEVAMQARLDYVNAVREAANLRVLDDLRRQVDERLRVTRQTFEAGRVPRYYVLRDETELANVVQMEAMARSRAEQALYALKTTLGLDMASSLRLPDQVQVAPLTISVEEAVARASERHPEVRAAVRQREAAESEVRAAYGNYYPQVSVSYMYDWATMRERRMPADGAEGYSVGVVVTLPLFDGFMRENALKTSKARRERASHAEAQSRQQIARDVHQAALMLAAAEKSVEASRKGLEQAEEESRVIGERFQSGRGIQLEVLDAQVALTRARFNAVNSAADYAAAQAMWLRAIGQVR